MTTVPAKLISSPAPHKDSMWHGIKRYRYFYIFIAPFFIPFILFWVWPLLHAFYLSLTKWSGFGDPVFIGLENYIKLLSDPAFHQPLGNTVLFTVVAVPLQVIIGLVLARMLNQNFVRFRSIFRAIFFSPFILSQIIVGTIFLFLLDSKFGIVNYALSMVGIQAIPWLTQPFWMRVSIIILSVWRWAGWSSVIFLAGMQNISPELEESARLDGASEIQIFTNIVIPLLAPLILFTTVTGTIGGLRMFAEPMALSANQKGPGNSAYTVVYAIWRNAFEFGQFGKASAMAFILFALTMVVSVVQIVVRRRGDS
jgi:ABC-type sugar transport system permease subunit